MCGSLYPHIPTKENQHMKTTCYLTLVLLTLVTLVLIPNSFAQDAAPEYVVGVIYLIPNDREPDPNIDTKLDILMKEAQQFYADVMEYHGFGSKTIRLETDDAGYLVVHHVNGKYNDVDYQTASTSYQTIEEINQQFKTSKNIYLLVLDISSDFFAGNLSGFAVPAENSLSGFAFVPASRPSAAAHELGHVFGLAHDKRVNANRIYGTTRFRNLDWMTTSFCAAEWLDVHPYFNTIQKASNENTSVKMLTPSLASPPDNIRLQFDINDPDGVHQAQLYLPLLDSIIAYQGLSGQNLTAEFVANEIVSTKNVILKVIDTHGNFMRFNFSIDIDNLLPPPVNIRISDINLAAAIREVLKLSSETITQLDMWALLTLRADDRQQIQDLTGLEHARNLKYLRLRGYKINDATPLISDITPLAKLQNLIEVNLSGNKIRDITPITKLPLLQVLELSGNSVSDISQLAGMTHLRQLGLGDNQINDLAPLTSLPQLWSLSLTRNQISDITLLAGLINLDGLYLSSNNISNLAPLAQLTNLKFLSLQKNNIQDITPLTGLTNLLVLRLNNNQISDVSPLTGLVNLKELYLYGNPIKNRKPLLTLLERNPDVKIYLKNYTDPLPVTLSHFRAELTDTGVTLRWITESEIDNAGFYIYRSETKDGEFKIVNPTIIQGAGTTAERNEYTWTDTTAKPNTIYYYRIEDISHAGVREQLATVRLRGLVSARGKLTTIWADLKAQK